MRQKWPVQLKPRSTRQGVLLSCHVVGTMRRLAYAAISRRSAGRFSRNASGAAAGRSVHHFDRRVECVADTAFGNDEPRSRRIQFDLPAQPEYLNVDRAVVHLVVVDTA